MKLGSINIRGLGTEVRKRKIRSLVNSESLHFLAIQETKLEVVSNSLCQQL